MANLKALAIQGIRSFGPDEEDKQIIVFSKPLTLILGQNGCGKTTIIECLRYAVTGQHPPGSRNECFVYDAKVNKSREIMGQVKLKVLNAMGHEVTVTRSMQVTSKEKRTTFKTLDGCVERLNTKGERHEISSRCADIDLVMQEELGVSKAIINSVIFCHQEDSSWPLDEAKKVKERFDEIFDCDKYSACFDKMRKIRKEYGTKIKLLEQSVQFLAEKKAALDRKKIDVVNNEKRMEEEELKIVKMTSDMRPIQEKLQAIDNMQRNLVDLENRRNKINNKLEQCREQQQKLKRSIKKIFEGSDEELKRNIENYESLARSKDRALETLVRRGEQLAADEEQLRRKIGTNEVAFNRLLMRESQYQEQVMHRNKILEEGAKEQDISLEDLEEEGGAARAVSALEAALRGLRERHRELRADTAALERRLQADVDQCRDALSRHDQQTSSKRQEAESARRQTAQLRRRRGEVDRSRARRDTLQTQLEQAEREREQIERALDTKRVSDELAEHERALERLDTEADTLNDTIQRLQTVRGKLEAKKTAQEALASKEKAFGVLRNKHRAALQQLLHTVPDKGYVLAVSEVECAARTEVEDYTKQRNEKQDEITRLESERAHVRELVRSARAELTAAEDKFYEACGDQAYDVTLAKVDATIDKLRDEQSTLQSSVFIISKYKKQLEDGGSCPLCNRGFESQSEVVQLMSELTTKVLNVPATLERVSEQLSRETQRRDQLVQLAPLNDKMAALRDATLPQLEARIKKLDKQLSECRESVEEVSMALAEPESRRALAAQLAPDMPLLDRYTVEIDAAKRDLAALEAACVGVAGDPTPEEAAARQKELRQQQSLLRASVKSKHAQLNAHTSRVQANAAARNKLKEQLLDIQKETQELATIEASLLKLEEDAGRADAELSVLQAEAPELRARLQTAERERDAQVEVARASVERAQVAVNRLTTALERAAAIERELERHNIDRARDEMATLKTESASLEERKSKLQQERDELAKSIDEIKDEIAKKEIYQRELEDNVSLRAAAVQEKECARDLAELNAEAGGIDTSALKDKERLIGQQTKLFKERTSAETRIDEIKKILSALKTELAQQSNRELEDKFRRELYELHVLRALDKDIKDYSAAMDKCLMQFHKQKMESINLIIREMWRRIYRGNDIDYIEIKTGEGGGASGDRRKFEYRVVQCKNGVEIDMRGRCSAGQKVLACLIIRLALAETFSTRFGVLALDEPTTNLDQDNIKSLCSALGDMVRARSRQKNFMFVLITHDKDFIESLGSIDKVTHYYEVSRNVDGKSRIKKIKF